MTTAGPNVISGYVDGSHIVLVRDDGSTEILPGILLIRGTLVDNGDGTNNIIFPED